MSHLTNYIEKVKEYKKQNPDITEEELIRYVYLDLGKRFSFDLKFMGGNKDTKKEIYNQCNSYEKLNSAMKTNIIICKSSAYLLEYILKSVGVNIRTVVNTKDSEEWPHVYNIITSKKGEEYIIDLQEDIENIQTHSFTPNFGISPYIGKPPVLKRFDIEKMDKKLGYIDDEIYYSDDYLYLLKSDLDYFTNFEEKVDFVLENIDAHENKDIKYAERKWHHDKILKKLFSHKERNKIKIIDCYKQIGKERIYKNCIAIDLHERTAIYMYSEEQNKYCKMSIYDFAKEVQNGLVNMEGVKGLKRALKELKQQNDAR